MAKVRILTFLKPVLQRVVNPAALWQAASLQLRRPSDRDRLDDAQLQFYAKVLPGDFLHYGYFEDVDRQPGDITLNDIVRAQNVYAELLIARANEDRSAPVLDVGCGMGGLVRMLLAAGFAPVAVSPARGQIEHVKRTYPDVPTYCCKFEDLDADAHAGRYSTVFTSESLQYLRLGRALPMMQRVLRPGGTWVACDFFNRDSGQPSRRLPAWPDFQQLVADAGWTITFQRDITAHVLPTLRYIHMWATRFGTPLVEFVLLKLQRKQPGLHHLVGGLIEVLEQVIAENVQTISPTEFERNKQYMLFTLRRRDADGSTA
jgi:SAM-dependent methyltransferase